MFATLVAPLTVVTMVDAMRLMRSQARRSGPQHPRPEPIDIYISHMTYVLIASADPVPMARHPKATHSSARKNPLARRLLQTLEMRSLGQRQLCRLAGLEPVHISNFLQRAASSPTATIETDTLVALAKGANVSVNWLATGHGSPETPDSRPSPGGLSLYVDGEFQPLAGATQPLLGDATAETDETTRAFELAVALIHGLATQFRVPEAAIDPLVEAVLGAPEIAVAAQIRAGGPGRSDLALKLAQLVVLRTVKGEHALARSRRARPR